MVIESVKCMCPYDAPIVMRTLCHGGDLIKDILSDRHTSPCAGPVGVDFECSVSLLAGEREKVKENEKCNDC